MWKVIVDVNLSQPSSLGNPCKTPAIYGSLIINHVVQSPPGEVTRGKDVSNRV